MSDLAEKIGVAIDIVKGGDYMYILDMYVSLVMAGCRTCIQADVTKTCKIVPVRYQEDVTAALLALGLDGSGNVIAA